MSWETFKQNVLRVVNNPETINDIDIIAKTYATEYDDAVKRGGDTGNIIPVQNGNVEAMEQFIKVALQKGLSSTTPYDLVGEMGKGVLAYWTGATLQNSIPITPALGAAVNIGVVTNVIISTGTWAPVVTLPVTNFELTQEKRAEYEQELGEQIEIYETSLSTEDDVLLSTRTERISVLTNIITSNEEYRVDIPFPKPIITSGTVIVDINGNKISSNSNSSYSNLGTLVDGDDVEEEDLGGGPRPTYSNQGGQGGGSGGGAGSGGGGSLEGYKKSTPYFPAGATIAQKCVQIALTDIKDGVKENGKDTGHPRIIEMQKIGNGGKTGFPWCACAAFTWWVEAGFPFVYDKNDPSYLVYPPNCNNWPPWGVRTDRWVEKRPNQPGYNASYIPKAGDAVLYDSPGGSAFDHIGIVYEFKDGVLTSIDGNFGRAVSYNRVYTKYIAGYVRI